MNVSKWGVLVRKILLFKILLLSSLIPALSANNITPPDSANQLRKILEQEHFLNLLRRSQLQPQLAATAEVIDLKHTIINAKLLLKENGEIEARAGLCLEYLNTDSKSISLSLGGGGIQVWSVLQASGDSLEYSYTREESLLEINLPANNTLDDTLWIEYSGEFLLSTDSDTTSQSLPEQLQIPLQEMTADYAYALGGPWFPSLPDDIDLQTMDIHLTVPEGFVAVATGDSTDVMQNEDGTITYSYSSKSYGPVYNTGSFTVGRYKKYSKTIGNVKTTLYSLEREAWNDNAERIEKIFDNISIILNFYQDLYGRTVYPWKELKIAEAGRSYFPLAVADLEWTILPQNIFYYNPDSLNLNQIQLLAHEIAHQWWGMNVIPDPAQSHWLAEGLAEFSARYMVERHSETQDQDTPSPWAHKQLLASSLNYAPALQMPISDPLADYFVVYEKGAWVTRMLLNLVGEENFKVITGSFLAEYSGKFVSLEEYSNYWQSQAGGIELAGFFNQWFYKVGTPNYITRGYQIPQQATANAWQVTVSQLSDWDMPVDIALFYPDETVDVSTQRIDRTLHEFVFTSDSGLPDSVRLDPENKILFYNRYPANISLAVKPNTMNVTEPAWVAVTVDSLFPQQNTILNWRVGGGGFQQLELDFSSSLTDTVYLPAQNTTAIIDFYLEVKDEYGQSLYYPDGAPDSLFSYLSTEYADFPEELAWFSFHYLESTGESDLERSIINKLEISIYDLERGVPLHTYPDAGSRINISPNNKFLVTDDYPNDELVIIDQVNGQIISRIPYYSDRFFQPQQLQITNDGKTVFMNASTGFPLSATLETYRVSVENKTLTEIDAPYHYGFEYNPVNNKLYLNRGSFKPLDIYNIETGIVEDSIVRERVISFRGNFSLTDNFRVLSEIFWGGGLISGFYNTKIILRKTSLLTGEVFETLTIELPELRDYLRSKTETAKLLPNSTKVVFIFREENNLEFNFWDFADPAWHRSILLEGFDNETFFTEIKTTSSGKKLLVSKIGGFPGPFMAVLDLETYQLERYFDEPDLKRIYMWFEVEKPPYSTTVKRGDVNLDDKIDIFDLLVLLDNLSGKNQNIFFESDVNDDGRIDIFDLLDLLKVLSN